MREVSLQMIDRNISSVWWKKLVRHFVRVGDSFEIRCWKEEAAEIQQASVYGELTEDDYEASVKGIITEALLMELLSEAPTDKNIYNKMTKYFTINAEHGQFKFCSAHYGTEMYLIGVSDEDVAFFQDVMNEYTEEDFSIHIDK